MTRRPLSTLVLVLLASLLFATPALAEKSYYAERFDVQVDIQENGSAIVTETVEFHFSGDPFRYVFREISAANTDGITFIDASMDGNVMARGTQAGHVELAGGNPLKVTWHFPPTSGAAHVFTVRYRAAGIIRKGDADTLIWSAIPADHDYFINHSTITLTYPPKATPLEQPALDWNHDARWEANRLILTASGLAQDEDLVLTAHFPLNSLTPAAPQWQVRRERASAARSQALPLGFEAGIITLILGALGLFSYARANARELNINAVISTANPPSDVPPAIIGKLTGQQHTFMGAIFDLAQRGVLEVQEERGFLGTRNHVLVRKDFLTALKPFEQGLVNALFKTGETQTDINKVAARLSTNNKLFDEPLERELIQRGWLDVERKQKRKWLTVSGVLMMVLSMMVLLFSMVIGGVSMSGNMDWMPLIAVVVGISAGAFILSILLLIYRATYSMLTAVGEEQSARWKGFAEYLKQVSKGREPATRPDYFEKYLAYAAVFGLGAGWAKYFRELGGVPLPVWFHGMAGGQSDFGAIVAVMSASDTAGASAGGDGGAGASGGGSSGAG